MANECSKRRNQPCEGESDIGTAHADTEEQQPQVEVRSGPFDDYEVLHIQCLMQGGREKMKKFRGFHDHGFKIFV